VRPSGSGKSTLAFDIVYCRRPEALWESLSAYARQFLPQMDKPQWTPWRDFLRPFHRPQNTSHNPRSTVELLQIHDFLRIFFARLGRACIHCMRPSWCALGRSNRLAGAQASGRMVILLAPLVGS
jgi:excinuclease ABC subunit A